MGKRLLVLNVLLGVALVAIRFCGWSTQPDRLPEGLLAVEGRIGGRHAVVVSPLAGRVKRLPVAVGDCLVKGQVVAELEDDALVDRDRQARYDLGKARGQVRLLTTDLDALHREAAAGKDVAEKEDALARAKVLESQVQARVDRIETEMFARLLTSPVNGVVADVFVAEGETLVAGAPVARIVDYDTLHFTGNLPEAQAVRLRVGLPGDIRLADRPHQRFPASVAALVKDPDRPETSLVLLSFIGEIKRCLQPGQAASALILWQ